MVKNLFLLLSLFLFSLRAIGQDDAAYLKTNAIRFEDPEKLSDSVYNLLTPYPVIMFGEMHGTNESAPFIKGLTNLFTLKGDSVLLGLEIPPSLMTNFLSHRTDSSVYESEFFKNPPFLDGKESFPWAGLIVTMNNNPKVKLFFFDINAGEGKGYERDSIMSAKIKAEYSLHPFWKLITLGGNYHNRISEPTSMTSVFKRNNSVKVCSINMEYKEGTCMANFSGEGFKEKALGSYPSVFNSTEGYNRYLLLYPDQSNYDYDGIYYTKYITAAKMTSLR